jgi:predicted esterase
MISGTGHLQIVFCHGDKDEYVPLFNSEKAYAAMKAKGADVTLEIFKGASHGSGVFSFLQQAFTNFEKAR